MHTHTYHQLNNKCVPIQCAHAYDCLLRDVCPIGSCTYTAAYRERCTPALTLRDENVGAGESLPLVT